MSKQIEEIVVIHKLTKAGTDWREYQVNIGEVGIGWFGNESAAEEFAQRVRQELVKLLAPTAQEDEQCSPN